jgi:magnesium transporter
VGRTRHKKQPPVGSRPGTLSVRKDAPPPRITLIDYDLRTVHEQTITEPRSVASHLQAGRVTWIDVQGLGDVETLQTFGRIFSIHPLALETIVHTPQRPKTELYESHQLYVSRMVRLGEGGGELVIEQTTVLFGRNYVLTFQEYYGDVLDPVRNRVRDATAPVRRFGPDFLAYAIVDAIVDYYYPVCEKLGDDLERLEHEVLVRPNEGTLIAINRVKRDLLDLRRGIWPQRDAINAMIRDSSPFITDDVRVYLRDTLDHVVQITDIIETYRDIASGLFNTYLSVVSNRLNQIIQVLTIMTVIFAPLTFIVGVYGMNFDMPELHSRWGYPIVWLVMLTISGGMLHFFRRRGWLGRRRR